MKVRIIKIFFLFFGFILVPSSLFALTYYYNYDSLNRLISVGTTLPDAASPTTPNNLQATAVSPVQINLSWSASTDNSQIGGYRIYRNGELIATINSTTYQDTNLSPPTAYTYTVSAFDTGGNNSSQSTLLTTATQTPETPRLITPWGTIALASPTYNWYAISGATQYNLYVNDSSGNKVNQWFTAAQAGCASGTGICSATPSVSLAQGSGNWKIQAQYDWGLGPWSSVQNLNIIPGHLKADFNADGKEDILFRNILSGDVAVWYMNGLSLISGQVIWPAYPLNLQIFGTGDFNNDGKTDILWRDMNNGDVWVWIMNSIIYGQLVSPGVSLFFEIVGTGDFNNDGNTDILWRNMVNGDVIVWFMNGTTVSLGSIIYSGMDLNWDIVGTGDFNKDGSTDILWRNKVSGDVAVWLMNGTTLITAWVIYPGYDLNWEIVGTGDFNTDGNIDILFRNKITGDIAVWLMNGTSLTTGQIIYPGLDLNWKIMNQ